MAVLMPLTCVRPDPEYASRVATGPHSALSKEEIYNKVRQNPYSFTRVVHPRALLGNTPDAFAQAAGFLQEWIRKNIMIEDEEPAFYLYRLEKDGHVQTGLVGRTPIDQILKGRIHAHETIRESKLFDLASHIEECGAQIGGPILMAYRSSAQMTDWIRRQQKGRKPGYRFRSENGVDNTIWRLAEPKAVRVAEKLMMKVGDLYIADGHHRIMAAVEICRRHRAANPGYTGEEPWNYLACVCFPDDELQILPYERVVNGLGEMTTEELIRRMDKNFKVTPCRKERLPGRRGEFILVSGEKHYLCVLRRDRRPKNVPGSLDVAVLQSLVLSPILGIGNPGRDFRLEFVGGPNYLDKMRDKCSREDSVGFLLAPTSMDELFAVADAAATMPPKSTWFEPKLCNGLFVYRLETGAGAKPPKLPARRPKAARRRRTHRRRSQGRPKTWQTGETQEN